MPRKPGPKRSKWTTRIDPALRKALLVKAAAEGRTAADLVDEALRAFLGEEMEALQSYLLRRPKRDSPPLPPHPEGS